MHKRRISRVVAMLLAAIMLFSFQGLTASATQNRDQYFSKSYTLTGNIRDDIVAVAAAQNGKTKAQLGFTEAWCANFVCGCAALAGIPNFPRNGSCDQLIVLLKKWGGAWYDYNSDYIPKKGDIVFFSSKGNTSDDSTHVGIIYQDGFVASKTVKTVEGNTSGVTSSCVNIKNRAVYGSLPIMGYISLTGEGSGSSTSTDPADYTVPTRTLYYVSGSLMNGSDVSWLQAILTQLGYKLDIDGWFGSGTDSAVRPFQKDAGLEVDGKVGPATRAELISRYEALSHTHDYTEIVYDEYNHGWRCSCGATTSPYAHTFSSWFVVTAPTKTETGSQKRSCTVCGYTEHQVLPAKGEDGKTEIGSSVVKRFKPTLDGLLDPEYLDSASVTLSGGSVSVTSYMTWADECMYICSVVTDDDVISAGPQFYTKQSGYSQNMLWTDALGYDIGGKGWIGTDANGYALFAGDSTGGTSLISPAGGDITVNKKYVRASRTADGYISEVCIPMTDSSLYAGAEQSFKMYAFDAAAGSTFTDEGVASAFAAFDTSVTLSLDDAAPALKTKKDLYGGTGNAYTSDGGNTYTSAGEAVILKRPAELDATDAALDAAYRSSYSVSFAETQYGRTLSGTAYYLWDASYLYIYAEINDPDRFAQIYSLDDPIKNDLAVFRVFPSDGSSWARIGVNATNMVNPKNNPVTSQDGYAYVIEQNGTAAGACSSNASGKSMSAAIGENNEFYMTRLGAADEGYFVELKVPMNSSSLKENASIRLSFGAIDVNGPNVYEYGASGTYDPVVTARLSSAVACGHTFNSCVTQEPAAGVAGSKSFVCSGCGETLAAAEIAALPYALAGDINGDGVIDSDDAVYLLRHTFNPDAYPLSANGDVNGDGVIDSDDSIYLLRYTFDPGLFPIAE